MHLHPARSSLLSFFLTAILSFLHIAALAQTNTTSSAKATPASTANLKAADVAFRAGTAAYQQNDLPTAHAQFAKLVHLAPNVAAGHSAFGTVLLAEGDAHAAVTELEQARKLDPHDSNATLNLALAYAQLRAYTKSVTMFELADQANQALTPEAAIAYATALVATSQPAAAQSELEKALSAQPDNASLHDTLGTVLAQQEHYDDAVAQFHQAISLDTNLASAHYHLGSVFLALHDPVNAVTELTKANTIAKDNIEYTLQLGRALRAANQDTESATVLRHALQLNPASIDAKYELALTLQASGNAHEALPLFEQVVASRPQDSAALTNLALDLVQLGNAKRAISPTSLRLNLRRTTERYTKISESPIFSKLI